MRGRRLLLLESALALGVIVLAAGVVRADAPVGQYAPFVRSSACITDNFTHLTWLRNPILVTADAGVALTLDDAASECAHLDHAWRVPSLNELETLVDEHPHPEGATLTSKAIDGEAFGGTPVGLGYWTSSLFAADPTYAWLVDFESGASYRDKTDSGNWVRCVANTIPNACSAPGP